MHGNINKDGFGVNISQFEVGLRFYFYFYFFKPKVGLGLTLNHSIIHNIKYKIILIILFFIFTFIKCIYFEYNLKFKNIKLIKNYKKLNEACWVWEFSTLISSHFAYLFFIFLGI